MAEFFRATELDRTTLPEWRERILAYEPEDAPPRAYPGYPRWPLPRVARRFGPTLDGVLRQRRAALALDTTLPAAKVLARLLQGSHGVTAGAHRGPVPSAGGLQALELYLAVFTAAWLPGGVYHYDRATHALAQLTPAAERAAWREHVPALQGLTGGALLWLLVGDGARVRRKYGARGERFLLLEAGHLMQNLCLLSQSVGLCTVPLGGYLEGAIARALALPADDLVLYVAACGRAQPTP